MLGEYRRVELKRARSFIQESPVPYFGSMVFGRGGCVKIDIGTARYLVMRSC